jgi:hypothetical protein
VVAGLPKPGQDGVGGVGGHQCLRSPPRPRHYTARVSVFGADRAHPAAELVPINAVVFPAAMTDAPTNDCDRA